MQKILPLLILATVFCPLSRATTAATIVISPSSDRTGEDLAGFGFENLRPESETNLFPSSPNPGLTEGSRAGLEFALSGIPVGATINSATLSLVNVGFGGTPDVIVGGYAGNGAVELADMTTLQNLVAGPFGVSQLFDPALAAIDTTSFVQRLITNGDSFAGFTVRITSLSSSLNIASKEHPTASFHPTLTVDYTPTAVPEPGSLLLAGFGITWSGAVSWVRRKRRGN